MDDRAAPDRVGHEAVGPDALGNGAVRTTRSAGSAFTVGFGVGIAALLSALFIGVEHWAVSGVGAALTGLVAARSRKPTRVALDPRLDLLEQLGFHPAYDGSEVCTGLWRGQPTRIDVDPAHGKASIGVAGLHPDMALVPGLGRLPDPELATGDVRFDLQVHVGDPAVGLSVLDEKLRRALQTSIHRVRTVRGILWFDVELSDPVGLVRDLDAVMELGAALRVTDADVARGLEARSLKDPSSQVRARALELLLSRYPVAAMKTARRILAHHTGPDLRLRAACALEDATFDQAVIALFPLAEATRHVAISEVLSRGRYHLLPTIVLTILAKGDTPAALALCDAYARANGTAPEAFLIDLLGFPSARVHARVAEVLARIGTAASVPALLGIAKSWELEAWLVARRAIEAIQGRIGVASRGGLTAGKTSDGSLALSAGHGAVSSAEDGQ